MAERQNNAFWAFKKGVAFENLLYYEKENHKVYNALSVGKRKGGIKKYYKGSIYIFDRVSHKLITVYKLSNLELVEALEVIFKRLERQRLPHVRGIVKK